MNRDMNCHEFLVLLDALPARSPGNDARDRLQCHADRCPECAVLLRMHEQLAAESPEELEARVPDELVQGMWSRLSPAVGGAPLVPSGIGRPRPGGRWLVPALAASVLALLFVSAFLFGALREAQGRERDLVAALEHQDVEAGMTGESRRPGRLTVWALRRALHVQSEFTPAQLRNLLEQAAPSLVVVSRERANVLLAKNFHWRALARRGARAGVRLEDGLTAGELIQLLASLGLNPRTKIPRARLIELLAR